MGITRSFIKLAAAIISVSLLTSCAAESSSAGNAASYALPEQIRSIKSGTVAENDGFTLSWDMERACVLLENKETGVIWSTIPYRFYTNSKGNTSGYVEDNLCSAIYVKYIDGENHVETDIDSNSDADYVMTQKLETGIRLTYYFDRAKISVPVNYRLEEDGVSVSVDVANIGEAGNKVYQISLLPFFASAENNTDSYLFVPSGSGALMYVDDNTRGARSYSEPVYGDDAGNQAIYHDTESETVRMPVFGAKNGENAILGIITSGAETAEINASAGDARFGYSGVYATFNIRGKSAFNIKGNANSNNRLVQYSEEKVDLASATVKYAVLDKENSDYNGMAEYYRNYLISGGMTKTETPPDALITLLGGVQVRRLALGIPYYSISELTDFEQAQSIISDIVKDTGASLAVNLKGFTENGLDSGKYSGGYTVDGAFGGRKGLDAFNNWCTEQGIDSFFDFDAIFFTESYKNFKVKNAAKSANDIRAKHSGYNIVTRRLDDDSSVYLIDRYSLATSANSLISAAEKLNLTGIGLSTLSSVAYSDYSTEEYYCKAHMSDDVNSILTSLAEKDIKTFGESANDYAAARLDYVFNTPSGTSAYYGLDMELPFYQMVFRGYSGISGAVINLSPDSDKEFLNSVLTGCSLAFTLSDHMVTELSVMEANSAIGASIYQGLSDDIKNYIRSAQPLYEALGGAAVEAFERDGDLAATTFSNGVKVVVNYSDNDIETEMGTVKANYFIFSGKAGENR